MAQGLDQDALKPVADDILKKADVQILGYAGGGMRNVFANVPVRNMDDLKGLPIRMQGAPIWTKVFGALGAAPTVIAYDEIYNAIQTGVIKAAENEAAGIQQMRFYEVGPYLALTQHAITVRPLCFAHKTLERLPPKLQEVILVAGKEGGHEGAVIESGTTARSSRASSRRAPEDQRVRGSRDDDQARRSGAREPTPTSSAPARCLPTSARSAEPPSIRSGLLAARRATARRRHVNAGANRP